ncbi:hypothetical protein [Pontibacter burrus]|uniref:Uncharacterized protein n=1 Tax=Pontibacter burrus TaxID=2704466 RepID=A0A6B3LQ46_9BACT|nr:hypothetical protein [Pontibacter burrus]NEM97195.1 hypothetical protein [Pontibacter burrus]
MRQLIQTFVLVTLLTSCDLLISKESKAIETCKSAKVQLDATNIWGQLSLSLAGLTADATWLDFANMIAKEDSNTKYDWSSKKTEEEGIYIVSFADQSGWGHKWEVTLDQQIVRHINVNPYLSRKYGFSRLDNDGKFKITDITIDTLKLESKKSYYMRDKSKDIVYVMKGNVINNTDKTLTSAEIVGKLQVIFKDKALESSKDWESGFKRQVTKSKPWKPQEKLAFYIKTKDIEEIYLQYEPEYVFFNVNISAEDPVGFTYDKAIEEYDLKDKWRRLKIRN